MRKIWIIVAEESDFIDTCNVYTDEEAFQKAWDSFRRGELRLLNNEEIDEAVWEDYVSHKMYGTMAYFERTINCD